MWNTKIKGMYPLTAYKYLMVYFGDGAMYNLFKAVFQ